MNFIPFFLISYSVRVYVYGFIYQERLVGVGVQFYKTDSINYNISGREDMVPCPETYRDQGRELFHVTKMFQWRP